MVRVWSGVSGWEEGEINKAFDESSNVIFLSFYCFFFFYTRNICILKH